jgi:hypothetical protein
VARDERVPPDSDVEVGAVARARKLRFKRKPKVEVTTRAHLEIDPALRDELPVEGEGGSRAERENLPDEVEPGVTYRDVRAGWRAGARLRLEDDGRRED